MGIIPPAMVFLPNGGRFWRFWVPIPQELSSENKIPALIQKLHFPGKLIFVIRRLTPQHAHNLDSWYFLPGTWARADPSLGSWQKVRGIEVGVHWVSVIFAHIPQYFSRRASRAGFHDFRHLTLKYTMCSSARCARRNNK